MNFTLLGWNFRSTPLEIRDRLSLTEQEQLELVQQINARCGIQESVLLSTCNRTELYLYNMERPAEELLELLQKRWGIPELLETHYLLKNEEAVFHLFHVASSLDSMVVGEPQILGQLKDAFGRFQENGLTGRFLYAMFTRAFSIAKRIRTETSIGDNAVSISYAAVELAKRIFDDIRQQKVLVIGAGEMAELAIRHLLRTGIHQLKVTNRTFANAAKLAEQFQASVFPFEKLYEELPDSDIVISSTGAREPILTPERVRQSLRKRRGRPMFFIDIAVPRDIDPTVNELSGVYCYDIDDLQGVVEQNREERREQSNLAEEIIRKELEKVMLWFETQSVIPTVKSLRESFQETVDVELEKTLAKLGSLTEKQQAEVEKMVRVLTNKLLHKPSTRLKHLSGREDLHLYLETLSELFDLNPSNNVEEASPQPALKLLKKQ